MVHTHVSGPAAPALDIEILSEEHKNLRRKTHETIKKVSDDYNRRLTFNTAIAAVMELCNDISKLNDREGQGLAVEKEAIETAVILLAPIVPHVCHSLWQDLGHKDPAIDINWPAVDESALVRSSITMIIQVNGKKRGEIQVAADANEDDIMSEALGLDNVQKFIEGKEIKMKKVIPGKLVTIAVK